MEEKLIVCECHNVEHQMFIYYDEEFNQAYVEFHLVKLPFWGAFNKWHKIYIWAKIKIWRFR